MDICTRCGGVTGPFAREVERTLTALREQGMHACHGHSEPVDDHPIPGTGGTALVHEYDPSRELVMIPKGASIFPLIDYEALWRVVQEVAERDSTYADVTSIGFDDVPNIYCCPFLHCDGEWTREDRMQGKPFPHTPECIVTKARALIEQRKQSPQITVKMKVEGES